MLHKIICVCVCVCVCVFNFVSTMYQHCISNLEVVDQSLVGDQTKNELEVVVLISLSIWYIQFNCTFST